MPLYVYLIKIKSQPNIKFFLLLFAYLSVCLSVCLFICLSTFMSACLSVCLFDCLIYMIITWYVFLSVYLHQLLYFLFITFRNAEVPSLIILGHKTALSCNIPNPENLRKTTQTDGILAWIRLPDL